MVVDDVVLHLNVSATQQCYGIASGAELVHHRHVVVDSVGAEIHGGALLRFVDDENVLVIVFLICIYTVVFELVTND